MKKLLIIIFCFNAYATVMAQSNFTMSYSVGFGTGDLGSFIDKTSWRGVSMDYRYSFMPNIAAGLSVGWTTFYEEKGRDTYSTDNESLTGKQFRYSNQVPIQATLTYFSKPDGPVNPFVTMGIGTMYTRRNTDMNVYTREQEAWHFLLQPEVGVQAMIGDGVAFSVSGKYYHGFEAGSDLNDPQSYFALNVGFTFLGLE
jgi:hypothetical protein